MSSILDCVYICLVCLRVCGVIRLSISGMSVYAQGFRACLNMSVYFRVGVICLGAFNMSNIGLYLGLFPCMSNMSV